MAEWKELSGFSKPYRVTDDGQVLGYLKNGTPRLLKVSLMPNGYHRVSLVLANGRGVHRYVHQLVASLFLGPCPEGYEIDHVDGDKANNRVGNLEYVTHQENMKRARQRRPWSTGQWRKLSAEDEDLIRASSLPQRVLAERYGVSQAHVSHVRTGFGRAKAHPGRVAKRHATSRRWIG